MFNDKFALTHAVLDGTKTMTRRIEKPTEMAIGHTMEDVTTIFHEYSSLLNAHCFSLHDNEKQIGVLNPRYNVGEVVAIAQRYAEIPSNCFPNAPFSLDAYKEQAGWNNKLFVKADLLPHHIKITDVRIERLQGISFFDCLRVGIREQYRIVDGVEEFIYYFPLSKIRCEWFKTPYEAYAALMDKINGKGTWEQNPWVVVYEFKKVD